MLAVGWTRKARFGVSSKLHCAIRLGLRCKLGKLDRQYQLNQPWCVVGLVGRAMEVEGSNPIEVASLFYKSEAKKFVSPTISVCSLMYRITY